MESIVIGTAGHIDHGKTALVKALTGRDTDTLEEEKRRGITINLGFAYFKLPCGKTAGIVDVPGHERFVKNMLAGASGIDVAMVVIAANEGIMPQTREHIDILGYMDIKQSIVVLTKIDMVDEEFKELVLEDTKEYLQDTFLKDAPLIEVDSLSGKGIAILVEWLNRMAENPCVQNRADNARMNIDRVFSVKGFGTVVTGTLSDGTIRVDEELEVYPGNLPVKARNLQIHEQNVLEAHAGQRTAINLAGVTTAQVSRGCVIAKKNSVWPTKTMDVFFSLTKNTRITLKKMERLKLYIGSRELIAKVIPLDKKQLTAGQEAYGQILLEQEAVIRKGDSFVLRTVSPVETVGGGRIIDPTSIRYRNVTAELLKQMQMKDTGTPAEMLEAFVKSHPFQTSDSLAGLVNDPAVSGVLCKLVESRKLILLQDLYLHPEYAEAISVEIQEILKRYHMEYPLRKGMSKAELQSRQSFAKSDREFSLTLHWLEEKGIVKSHENLTSLSGFSPQFSPRQRKIREDLENRVKQCGYTLTTVQELVDNDEQKRQVMEILLKDTLMAMDGQMVIDRKLYGQAKDIVRELSLRHGVIKLSDFRDMLQTSRKYALLLLERFDKEKLTKRSGEDRILL